MSSLNRKQGYLVIDHTASPGLPEGIARRAGMDPSHCGEGKLFEAATLTCSHCKGAWIMNPERTRARAYCRKCDHYICDGCHAASTDADYSHTPFDKFLDSAFSDRVVVLSPQQLLQPR